MNCYVRVSPAPGGTAPARGGFDLVYSPHDATRMSYDDADFFRKKAFQSPENKDVDWEIVKVGNGEYVVKGERA
jgi:hypothetical protein